MLVSNLISESVCAHSRLSKMSQDTQYTTVLSMQYGGVRVVVCVYDFRVWVVLCDSVLYCVCCILYCMGV